MPQRPYIVHLRCESTDIEYVLSQYNDQGQKLDAAARAQLPAGEVRACGQGKCASDADRGVVR